MREVPHQRTHQRVVNALEIGVRHGRHQRQRAAPSLLERPDHPRRGREKWWLPRLIPSLLPLWQVTSLTRRELRSGSDSDLLVNRFTLKVKRLTSLGEPIT